jgi:hypothetical protein
MSRKTTSDRKVQTGLKPGMEHKFRLAIAGVPIFYSHVESGTDSELTEFESNRDE